MWVKGEIFRDLGDARRAARGSLDRDRQASLFDRIEWFERIWTYCQPGDRPLIVHAHAERAHAWLFLAQSGKTAKGLAAWYTLAYRLVINGAADDKAASALVTAIARRLRKPLATITFDHVPAANADIIRRGFARAGWIGFVTPQTANWTVVTEGQSFEEFWAQRPGQLRSTAKRKAAKMAIETQIFDRFEESAWTDYEAVYAASWKPQEGSLPFLRAMAETEGAAGALRMGIARIDGQAVAAQLWTVDRGTAIIHKLAHREDAAEKSPGTILSKALFAHVIDSDRVSLIDFGTGDDRYKADWMTDRTMRMRVALYNSRRPAGLLGAARARMSGLVARLRSR